MSESTKKWLLLKEIASYSAQPEKQHVYKSGLNKGKVKIIKARPAKSGLLPKPIPLSEGIRVWRVEEINEWIAKKEEGITHE